MQRGLKGKSAERRRERKASGASNLIWLPRDWIFRLSQVSASRIIASRKDETVFFEELSHLISLWGAS